MIPKAKEVMFEYVSMDELKWSETKIDIELAMKEYGRRLLDHVAEVAEVKSTGSGFLHEYVVDKQSILKIKDEL